jgi:hypothetical protein
MAAGLGFKTFTTGEVLTAADVNGYLMQGVLVFASEAARDAAITSPQEGQFAFTKDNNSLWYYDSAAWVASGATGDIEGVTAGTGISGGGTSGTVTITNSMATEIDAKGDLVVGTGADTFARLAVGTDGYTLVADSLTATGLAYAAPASAGGMTLLSTTTLSGASTTISGIDQTYVNLFITITGVNISANSQLKVTLNGTQNVDHAGFYGVAGGSTALWADDTDYVIGLQMASGQTGNSFAYTIVRYAETLIKSVNCFGGFIGAGATNYGNFIAGKTESTTAITSTIYKDYAN